MRDQKVGPFWIITMLAGYAISSFATGFIETNYLSNLRIRANGDENAVSFGMFNATVTLLLLGYFISSFIKQEFTVNNLKFIRPVVFMLFILSCIATLTSGSRASIVLIPIGVLIMYFINYSKIKATVGVLVLISAGILTSLTMPNSAFINKLLNTPNLVSSYFTVHNKSTRLKNQRLEQWDESLCIFKKHPITGTGPRSFKQAHQQYGGVEHCDSVQYLKQGAYQAHSLYFNTISTLGLLGFTGFLILFTQLIRISNNGFKQDQPIIKLGALLLTATIISHLLNGLTLDLVFRNHIIDKFLIAIALPLILIFYKPAPATTP